MKKDRIPTEQKAGINGADMDKIEVLMAVYNGSAYIREQIDSILNQTYENWHLTISDDGSTDGTDLIADEYAAKYPEQITRVYSGVRFGNARDHFMWLSENCTSRYMLYSDQDDVFNPEKMSRLMDAMQNAERQWGRDLPILVFSDQTVVDEKLNVIEPSLMRCQKQAFDSFDYHALLIQNVVTGGAMMVNRPLCSLAVQCRSRERIIMHDWWMAATAARFGKVIYLDEPLSLYRQHGGNSVGAKAGRKRRIYRRDDGESARSTRDDSAQKIAGRRIRGNLYRAAHGRGQAVPEQNETEQKRNPVLSEKQGIYPRLFQVYGLGHAWIK